MSNAPQYDVVIVGAGIAGAIIAKELGEKGKKVLILEAGQDFRQGTSREKYLETYYKAVAKVPEAPYNSELYAPNALTLQIDNYERAADGKLKLKPGTTSYLDQQGRFPFSSTYERRAGGTMWHWLGTSLRMLPNDFKTQTLYGHGVDWPIGYEELDPWYSKAEYLIGVSADVQDQAYHGIRFQPGYDYPMEALPPSQTDQYVAKNITGLKVDGQELTVRNTPAGRNSRARGNYDNGRRTCAGNTSCVPICPIQAKYDPTVTLAQALQTGNVEMRCRSVAVDVKVDAATGKINGIEYIRYDENGPGPHATVTGKLYVLAAHAIETPRLLLNSSFKGGVANGSGQVGRNLMDHPELNTWAMLPEKVYPFRGPISTSGIEELRDGEFRKHRSAFRIEIHNLGWNWPKGAPYNDLQEFVDQGLFGAELRKALNDRVARQIDLNFLIDQQPSEKNRVTLSATKRDALGIPQPEIHYDIGEYEMKGFVAAYNTAAKIFEKIGATNHTDFSGDAAKPNYFRYDNMGFLFQGAGHIVGTCRMGNDRKTSVVNKDLRSWDHGNLFMLGSGVFPTIATSNPTLTIAALTLRAAETMLLDLKQM